MNWGEGHKHLVQSALPVPRKDGLSSAMDAERGFGPENICGYLVLVTLARQ